MTREEVIRLAKNYCDYSSDSKGRESFEFNDYGLYFFAEVVAAEQQKRIDELEQQRDELLKQLEIMINCYVKIRGVSSNELVTVIKARNSIDRAKESA